ncbi:hypothetical protein SISSUDRAFT_983511 [Sistotremastrum suecicum HHB10207 ss-3]|uniref:Pyridoxamine 5'-phosphate oxidase N-terminal domain-containing protein n=1 Tax=Sistotremastrum suecicum HHB10207 ss-3 TaxID=1314776 RepID=A0A166F5P0_9AGAM|nr:hypothetical protein SISSUDRAFT_983511 [Sistotremastrum suecicum HHB10207 ss-3]
MGKFFEAIPERLIPWIREQHLFWVATAPLSADGHVNVSPKGVAGTFTVVDPTTVWYEDLTGSGIETISHLRENGRMTILFNAFDGPPRILRLFGIGTAYEIGTPEYESYIPFKSRKPGSRAVIVLKIHKVGTSCGYAVPKFDFRQERSLLLDWAGGKERKQTEGSEEGTMAQYWKKKNSKSIDGLLGLEQAIQQVGPLLNTPHKILDADSFKSAAGSAVNIGRRQLLIGYLAGIFTVILYFQVARSVSSSLPMLSAWH